MPEKKRVYTPSTGYDIRLKIKDLDYSNDLRSVRLVSTVATAYQIITLTMSLDPNDVILQDVMANEPMKLSIKLIGRSQEKAPQEDVQLELQYITSDSKATSTKSQITTGTQKDRTPINIIAICRKPFKTMTSKVNGVFKQKNPRQIIQQLSQSAGAELIYDTDSENTEMIDQIVIPPTTLYKTIKLLDNNYGLFDGASNLGFCQYDNKIYVQNLTARMNKDQTFTIYQLAGDSANNPDIIKKCDDGKNFYTYGSLSNNYSGASKISSVSPNVNYVVKPRNSFYKVIKKKIDTDFFTKYGAISKNSELKIDNNLNDTRERYVIGHSGNNDSEVFANAKIARSIIGLSTVQIAIEKNLPILGLLKVGEPVKLKTGTVEYTALSGKYLLKSSDISFTRNKADWFSGCVITIMRTNQYI